MPESVCVAARTLRNFLRKSAGASWVLLSCHPTPLPHHANHSPYDSFTDCRRPRSQHHPNPIGVDGLESGEPLTSWWMLSMARLYLSHSLCMLSKLKKESGEGGRESVSGVIGLQYTQLAQTCRARQINAPPEASREPTRLQNTNMAGQPEATCSDSPWPRD